MSLHQGVSTRAFGPGGNNVMFCEYASPEVCWFMTEPEDHTNTPISPLWPTQHFKVTRSAMVYLEVSPLSARRITDPQKPTQARFAHAYSRPAQSVRPPEHLETMSHRSLSADQGQIQVVRPANKTPAYLSRSSNHLTTVIGRSRVDAVCLSDWVEKDLPISHFFGVVTGINGPNLGIAPGAMNSNFMEPRRRTYSWLRLLSASTHLSGRYGGFTHSTDLVQWGLSLAMAVTFEDRSLSTE